MPTAGAVRTTVVVALERAEDVQRLTALLTATPDLEVVGEATSGADALANLAAAVPDVALIGLDLPDHDGVDLCTELDERLPGVRVVVVADQDDDRLWSALLAGAMGVLLYADLEEDGAIDPAWAVRRAARGEAQLTAGSAALLLDATADAGAMGPTARERDVLTRLAAGRPSSDIAAEDEVPDRLVNLAVGGALMRYRNALEDERAAWPPEI